MRRALLSLTLVILLVAGGGRWALAHAVTLFGHTQVDAQGQVSVRIVDVYGAALEGQSVTAFATLPSGRSTRPVDLVEGPPGTYRALVAPPPGAVEYDVTIDLKLAGDLHQIILPVKVGESQPEKPIPMSQIDPPQTPWGRILYIGAAAVVLVVATVVALRKKRPAAEGE